MTTYLEATLNSIRFTRDRLLKNTDWTQTSDSPLSPELKAKYREYRQQLRDMPSVYAANPIEENTLPPEEPK